MPILSILSPLISWIFRGVVVKFVILTGIFAVMAIVIPAAISYLAPHLGVTSLNAAFGGLGSDVWFYLDFFALGYGIPLLISAAVTRFLIRRLPIIG